MSWAASDAGEIAPDVPQGRPSQAASARSYGGVGLGSDFVWQFREVRFNLTLKAVLGDELVGGGDFGIRQTVDVLKLLGPIETAAFTFHLEL